MIYITRMDEKLIAAEWGRQGRRQGAVAARVLDVCPTCTRRSDAGGATRQAAAAEMDGQDVDGRMLTVCFAQKTRKSGGEMVCRAGPLALAPCLAIRARPCAADEGRRTSHHVAAALAACSLLPGLLPSFPSSLHVCIVRASSFACLPLGEYRRPLEQDQRFSHPSSHPSALGKRPPPHPGSAGCACTTPLLACCGGSL